MQHCDCDGLRILLRAHTMYVSYFSSHYPARCFRLMGAAVLFPTTDGYSGNGQTPGLSWIYVLPKELVPVLLNCAECGSLLARKNILLLCDKLKLSPLIVMHLLCCLWFFNVYFDIALTVSQINTLGSKYLS